MKRHLCWIGLAARTLFGCDDSLDAETRVTVQDPAGIDASVADAASIADAAPVVDASANVPPSSPCGRFAGPTGSTYPAATGVSLELTFEGLERAYKVYVPSSYRNDVPTKVLYLFHGLSGDAETVALEGTNLDASAEANGFLLVMPSGYDASWNAGDCCGTAQEEGVDDVAFVREVQKRLTSDLGLCVDPSRVYATGYSNGAFLVYRLACEASDLFAAVASVGGTMAIPHDECAAHMTRPMPLLELHGALDWIAPLNGQDGKGAVASVAEIASLDGCSAGTVPATVPRAVLDTHCETHPGCAGGAEVTLCIAAEGGHCWYGSATCGTGKPLGGVVAPNAIGIDANTAVWSFVSRFACAECGR